MNSNLANQLLASIMKWDPKQLATERAALEFMGSMKYDTYGRYMPGTRFMSSLVQWLNQLEDAKDRDIAFKFIKEKLVFISSTQMNYLVDLLYDSKMRPILQKIATTEASMPSYMLSNKEVRRLFDVEKRSSLIIGLSDGAHTDILRRSAGLSNEQVLTNYYPDGKKLDDMLAKLRKDKVLEGEKTPFFKSLFLVDDFTASGKSFIRYDQNDGKYHGKLQKIIEELCIKTDENDKTKHLSLLIAPQQQTIRINILFCIATEKAMKRINEDLKAYLNSCCFERKVNFNVDTVQILEDSLADEIKGDPTLMLVLKKDKYFDETAVITDSYEVGEHNKPWLGFDECALPVVLSHNTPNNSLPILWQDSNKFRGLFPRISRH